MKDDEIGVVHSSIEKHKEALLSADYRTIGEYINAQPEKRGRYLDRSMFYDEFEELWKCQSKYDPTSYNEEFKSELWNALFEQRELKSQKHLVGKCDLEPLRKRCRKSSLSFQEYRILCSLANLQVIEPIEGESHFLTIEQKSALFSKLNRKEYLTWTEVKKTIGIGKADIINLKQDGVKNLTGNTTAHSIIQAIGENRWDSLSDDDKNRLATELTDIIRMNP